MLLSIGMIVRNEEEHLRDCLEGISPILEQLNAELIINDTGSTDATIKIAKEFTPNVFETEWQSDFAQARQQTLERAKGEWYMYIDADEIFNDVAGIIDFFKSGEYKNYASAGILLKHMKPKSRSENLAEAPVLRLFKVYGKTKWFGKVCEYLEGEYQPAKKIDSYATHYGYSFESEEASQAKFTRNIVPLLEMHEQDPKNARVILNIVTEYRENEQNKESLKYVNKGLALFNENSEDVIYHCLCQHKVVLNYVLKDGESAIQASRTYFNTASGLKANAPQIRFTEAASCQALHRFEEAAQAYEQILEYLKMKENKELDDFILFFIFANDLAKAEIVKRTFMNYACAGNFKKAFEYREKFDKDDTYRRLNIFGIFAHNGVGRGSPKELGQLYSYARRNFNPDDADYYDAIAAIESTLINPDIKQAVANAVCEAHEGEEDDYIRLHNLRRLYLSEHVSDYFKAQKALQYFIEADKPFPSVYGDIIVAAIKYNADFTSFYENLHVENPQAFSTKLLQTSVNLQVDLVDYLKSNKLWQACKSVKVLNLVSLLLSLLTLGAKDHKHKKNLRVLFEEYVRIRNKYFSMIYEENIYNAEKIQSLPEQNGFVFFSNRAFIQKDEGDIFGYVKNLRHAVGILPSANNIIHILVSELEN